MVSEIKTIKDVVDYQLCAGCGMCAVQTDDLQMIEVIDLGKRPDGKSIDQHVPDYCPGAGLQRSKPDNLPDSSKVLFDAWGPVLEVWEGYASDEGIRYKASSGGGITALASYLLDSHSATRVIHTGQNKSSACRTETVVSKSSKELLDHSGSRYCASSPCEGVDEIFVNEGSSVFIGKPCDSAALRLRTNTDDVLASKVALNISFFCAGTPSSEGNVSLVEREGIAINYLKSLKYRGEGWPGLWRAIKTDGQCQELTYADSWGYLQQYRQWRCYICPDHSGEFSDISFGDPWHNAPEEGDLGKSMIVVRTERGREALHKAVSSGYITLEREDLNILPLSQPNLLKARGALLGRLFALRLSGCKIPKYQGYSFFQFWWSELNYRDKFSSFAGTFKRIYKRKLYRRLRR
ncbi:Coenzyme F420 hydrogenase/dehydrogenase, beta subunit C-terminal domain [Neptuniibacter caesariensis]|nr:Coenzyme F420 hydrogenase/dehydrogenase, beta subunit C-terminal domain [Neptuniibacter caesariensis]